MAVLGFLVGLAIGIFAAMAALHQKRKIWYVAPVAYSLLVNFTYAGIHDLDLDVVATIGFALFLIVIGWAIAKYEISAKV